MEPLEYVTFGTALATLPVNLICIHVMALELMKCSTDNSAFFKICLALLIVDEASLLNTFLIVSPAKWGWCVDYCLSIQRPLLYFSFYLSWAMGLAQVLLTAFLALNRYTVITMDRLHRRFWNGDVTCGWIYGILVTCLFFSCLIFFSDVEYVPNDRGGMNPRLTNDPLTSTMFGVTGTAMLMCCCAVVYWYSRIFLTLRNSHLVEDRGKPRRRRELNLLVMSFITCVIFFMSTIYIVSKLFGFDKGASLYGVVNVVNPYLLLAFSDALRRRAVQNYGWCRRRKSLSVVVLHGNTNTISMMSTKPVFEKRLRQPSVNVRKISILWRNGG